MLTDKKLTYVSKMDGFQLFTSVACKLSLIEYILFTSTSFYMVGNLAHINRNIRCFL